MKTATLLLPGLLITALLTSQALTLQGDEKSPKEKPAASKSATPKPDDEDRRIISVVLLQKQLPELTETIITEKIQKAWGIVADAATDKSKDALEFVLKSGPGFIVQTEAGRYMVFAVSKPYIKDEAIEGVDELRSRKVLKDHRAWLSVDYFPLDDIEPDAAEKSKRYHEVAQLAAELVDDNTVGVIVPSENILLSYTENLQALLKEKDPISALRESKNVPVVNASDDEPRMKEAVAEARKTWPQFVTAFRKKAKNTESFGVKFPFDTEIADRKEFMWVEVTSITDEFVSGQLANDPVWTKDLKLGDKVKKKVSELSDWMYLQDGEMVGGFSVKILMEQQDEKESDTSRKKPGKDKASK